MLNSIEKQLLQIVCICKGINLRRVLKGLPGSQTVSDVHAKVGTGCGGCQGRRCSPRIKILIEKQTRDIREKEVWRDEGTVIPPQSKDILHGV